MAAQRRRSTGVRFRHAARRARADVQTTIPGWASAGLHDASAPGQHLERTLVTAADTQRVRTARGGRQLPSPFRLNRVHAEAVAFAPAYRSLLRGAPRPGFSRMPMRLPGPRLPKRRIVLIPSQLTCTPGWAARMSRSDSDTAWPVKETCSSRKPCSIAQRTSAGEQASMPQRLVA